MKIITGGFLLLILLTGTAGQSIRPCYPYELTLQTVAGKSYSLQKLKSDKAAVFVFLLPDCPACQSYTPTLNNLSRKYGKQSVQFIGVVPGNYATPQEISGYVSQYKVVFPVVRDSSNRLVKCLSATVAPEAFVVDSKSITRYAGRIDDWMVALGKKRPIITAHDLEDAIVSVLKNKEVKVKKTKAIGCYIE